MPEKMGYGWGASRGKYRGICSAQLLTGGISMEYYCVIVEEYKEYIYTLYMLPFFILVRLSVLWFAL
jgi:hypothetical protein